MFEHAINVYAAEQSCNAAVAVNERVQESQTMMSCRSRDQALVAAQSRSIGAIGVGERMERLLQTAMAYSDMSSDLHIRRPQRAGLNDYGIFIGAVVNTSIGLGQFTNSSIRTSIAIDGIALSDR